MIRNRKGSVTTETLLVTIFLLFFMVLGPDLIMLGGNYFRAYQVASDLIEQGTVQGEITQAMANNAKDFLTRKGIGVNEWNITYSSGLVGLGMTMECRVSGYYAFKAFRLVGINLNVPVAVKKTGVSQVYVR